MRPATIRALTLILVIAGILLAGLFGARTLRALREFQHHRPPASVAEDGPPAETDVERIRDWMTVPFIAKLYHVRPRVLFDALGIEERGNREKSLRQLNEQYFPQTPGIVEAKIKAAILEMMTPSVPPDADGVTP
jgi:hypothetical protein